MATTWIILVVAIVLFVGVVYGLYTRRGSGINQRPLGPERGDAQSGAAGPSRLSASESDTEGTPDQHGTR